MNEIPAAASLPRDPSLAELTTPHRQAVATPGSARRKGWGWTFWIAVGIACTLFGNWILPRLTVALDLVGSFQLQWVACGWILAVILFLRTRRRAAALVLLLFALPTASLLAMYLPLAQPDAVTPTIRILTFNVLNVNHQYAETLQMIRDESPDLVGFLEFDEAWVKALDGQMQEYPHRVGPFHGNMIYSKIPFDRHTTRFDTAPPRLLPCCYVYFSVGGQPVYFMLVHTSSPKSPGWMAERNAQINSIQNAMLMASAFRHVIVAGDFNTTSHSYPLETMLKTSGLRDSRQGFGLQHSWPTWFWPISVCIDHCFVSDGVRVEDRRCGPDVGSDHLPVIVDVAFAAHRLTQVNHSQPIAPNP